MSVERTLLLGFIAGVTIVLGCRSAGCVGRRPICGSCSTRWRLACCCSCLGRAFAAYEPIDAALGRLHDNTGGIAPVVGYGLLLAAGLIVGLMSLVYYEQLLTRDRRFGPGTMAAAELSRGLASWSPARRLALLIAVGIGLHNFAEGLAIGGSAARGEIGLAVLLVIGFGCTMQPRGSA